MQHTATCCNTLQHAATRCNTLGHTRGSLGKLIHMVYIYIWRRKHAATRCNILHHSGAHARAFKETHSRGICICVKLQHTATHWGTRESLRGNSPHGTCRVYILNVLQHAATHCNTRQHTATCTAGGLRGFSTTPCS